VVGGGLSFHPPDPKWNADDADSADVHGLKNMSVQLQKIRGNPRYLRHPRSIISGVSDTLNH